MKARNVVDRATWLEARMQLLAKEKALDKQRDELTRARQAMPWVKVSTDYVFDGPNGRESLADLFEGRSQLIVYHFMYHPSWGENACKSCSFWADNFNGVIVHLNARDVSMVAISKARQSQIAAYQQRMGWTFKWLSSYDNEFNRDYHVSFTEEEVAKESGYFNYKTQRVAVAELPGCERRRFSYILIVRTRARHDQWRLSSARQGSKRARRGRVGVEPGLDSAA